MAITYVDSTQLSWGAVAAPQSVAVPTGTTTGDIVIVFFAQHDDSPWAADPTSNAQAFTDVCAERLNSATSDNGSHAWYRVWTGDEGSTIDFSSFDEGAVGHIAAAVTFRGVDTSTPFDVTPDAHASGDDSDQHTLTYQVTDGAIDVPGITTSTNGAFVVQISSYTGTGLSGVSSSNGSATEAESQTETGRSGLLITYEEQATAGAYTAAVHTYVGDTTNENGTGLVIALKPSGGASSIIPQASHHSNIILG